MTATMKITNITKITLYTKGCYGCDRHDEFRPLRQFVILNQLPLGVLLPKRIETSLKFQREAESLGKSLPAVAIERDGEDLETLSYNEFLKKYKSKIEQKKKKQPAAKSLDASENAPNALSAGGVNDDKEENPVEEKDAD